jgi:hypothetical protein
MKLDGLDLRKIVEGGLPPMAKAGLKALPHEVEDWINGVLRGAARMEPWSTAEREEWELRAHRAISRTVAGGCTQEQMLLDSMTLAVGPLLTYLHGQA